jgi:hypothetical protein
MNFNMKYDIYAEAKAVLNMRSPLATFSPADIGSFVLAWSSKDTTTSIRGTLMAFGCDSEGEYAMVKPWASNSIVRYTLVAPLPSELCPSKKAETETKIWRDPDVKAPGMPL